MFNVHFPAMFSLSWVVLFVLSRDFQFAAWAQMSGQGTGRVGVYTLNRHYLQDSTGKPFVIIGFGNEEKNDSSTLKILAGKVTYQRAYAASWQRLQSPNDYKFGRPWPMVGGKADMGTWNETFWLNLKNYIENARDRGIIVGLTIWDGHYDLPGGKAGADSVWNAQYNLQGIQWAYDYDALVSFSNPTPRSSDSRERLVYHQRQWVDRLMNEVKGYPNVLIELNNEDSVGASENWWLWWAQYFKDRGGFVVAINEEPNGSRGGVSDKTFASTPLLDMKSYHTRSDTSITSTRLSYNKVMVADADNACDDLDAASARKMAWRSFLKGGHWNDFVCFDTAGFPNSTKIQYYGHLLNFIKTRFVPFAEMSPNNSLVSTGSALSKSGLYYLAYVEGNVDLDLSAASGTLDYEWYNPRTGNDAGSGQVQGGAIRTFFLPGSDDFVLWVHASVPLQPTNVVLR